MTLDEAAERARHDLGKYVALQTRWVGVEGDVEELRAALIVDLRRTRSGPGAITGVAGVWAGLRGALAAEERLVAEVAEVDRIVAELALRDLEALDEAGVRETAKLALSCARAARELARAATAW